MNYENHLFLLSTDCLGSFGESSHMHIFWVVIICTITQSTAFCNSQIPIKFLHLSLVFRVKSQCSKADREGCYLFWS